MCPCEVDFIVIKLNRAPGKTDTVDLGEGPIISLENTCETEMPLQRENSGQSFDSRPVRLLEVGDSLSFDPVSSNEISVTRTLQS